VQQAKQANAKIAHSLAIEEMARSEMTLQYNCNDNYVLPPDAPSAVFVPSVLYAKLRADCQRLAVTVSLLLTNMQNKPSL
jgi:hypothetical protein